MAYDSVNAYGKTYSFGFKSSDGPSLPDFFPRSAELRHEPETLNEAKDSQGITMFVTSVRSTKRKITGTFTGYVTNNFDPSSDTFPLDFTFKGKYFIINTVGRPMPKGNFHEVVIEANHYANI